MSSGWTSSAVVKLERKWGKTKSQSAPGRNLVITFKTRGFNYTGIMIGGTAETLAWAVWNCAPGLLDGGRVLEENTMNSRYWFWWLKRLNEKLPFYDQHINHLYIIINKCFPLHHRLYGGFAVKGYRAITGFSWQD